MCGGTAWQVGSLQKETAMLIVAYFFGGLFVFLFILMALAAISVDKHSSTDWPEGGYEDRT